MGLGNKVIWVLAVGSGIVHAKSATSLTVSVYNYAAIPRERLAKAEAFAARSFRTVGIELTWVECPTSKDDTERFRACQQANDGPGLFLKILPERIAAWIPRSKESEDILGIALASDAFVLYLRVREMADDWRLPEYVVLGRTMAHELGHLLLGENSHAATGLMKPRFSRHDVLFDSTQFAFDPRQAARLRKWSVRSP